MQSYRDTKGRRFTLAHHTLPQWAAVVQGRLLNLGCSEKFINSEVNAILKAKGIPLIGRRNG